MAALSMLPASDALSQQAPAPTREWSRSSPAKQGLDSVPLKQLVSSIRAGGFGFVDRFVVVKNGYVVMDERFVQNYDSASRGQVSALGCGVGSCPDSSKIDEYNYIHPQIHPWYRGRDVHTLQSVTKSVTATLIGIAQARGEVKGVNTPLLSYFKDYNLKGVDKRLEKATLADLLTMRSGIEWHESDRPLNETNTTLQLERSRDWIQFTLDQPMDSEPGTKWVYNSGGSALMAEIIRSTTGKHVDKYAEQYLFGPLGIRDYHWKKTPTGHPDTEGGLFMNPLDLAKIGMLYLQDGVWDGQRILPPGWAKEATSRIVDHTAASPASPGYGYQWWRYDRRGVDIWAGNGFGGQFLIVVPSHNIVAVVNSWNIFGGRVPGVLGPAMDAVLTAAGVPPAAK